MKPYSHNIGYSRELARKKRRVFILRFIGIFFIIIIFILGLAYLTLFSPYIKIKDVNITGNQTVLSEDIYSEVEKVRSRKMLGILDVYQNYLFFDTEEMVANILEKFPVIKSVNVKKRLIIHIYLRLPKESRSEPGVFRNLDKEICKFFDEDGCLWGETAMSQGSVFLSVVEEGKNGPDGHFINTETFLIYKNITTNLAGKLRPLSIVFTANGLKDIRVNVVGGFYVLFSRIGIEDQLRDLKIFMAEEEVEPTFNPEYLDLRIKGRVYYK